MITERPKILLALHDPDYRSAILDLLTTEHDVIVADSLMKMLAMIENSRDNGHPRIKLHIMDTNLGFPGINTYEPAAIIYKCLGRTGNFMSVTGCNELVAAANQAGIPCTHKINFISYF